MVTDKEILDSIHINIHALRLLKGYKPSDFEIRTNRLIAERYSSTCKECKDRVAGHQAPTTQPTTQSSGSSPSSNGFFNKLGKWANGAYENAKQIE
jgi:hypothetical protein